MKKNVKYRLIVFVLLMLVSHLAAASPGTEIKNIVLFIGDGMGLEHIRAAGMYLNGEAGTLVFEGFQYQGRVTTYPANGMITDSAAAATAMATGKKVNNGTISMAYPGDGSELPTLLEYYASLGKSTGLVTTTYITHATPAAFGAHEPRRSNLEQIAADYFTQTRPTLLLGGGGSGVSPELAQANGYIVVTTKEELANLEKNENRKVSGQFGTGNLPYEDGNLSHLPTLREMTEAAVALLEKNRNGFFLMIEGGRIDHGGHANDIEKTVKETIGFHNAVSYVYEWAQNRRDTFIVVTADHETGGLEVLKNNGKGNLPSVTWTTTGHTSKKVGIYAYGDRGSGVNGVIDNTDIYSLLLIPTFTLTVQSTPDIDIGIMVSPVDISGSGNGRTEFTRVYNEWAKVMLTAPYLYKGKRFSKWTIDGSAYTSQAIRVTMDGQRTVKAYYDSLPPTSMRVNRTALNFGYAVGGSVPSSQSIGIINDGSGTLRWTASSQSSWIYTEPTAGSGTGIINVFVEPAGLAVGNYTGDITITDLDGIHPAQRVTVNLSVKLYSGDQPPIGSFDSPVNGSTVSSSIPVTGWALDDVELEGVRIYRDPIEGNGNQPVYIGDAFFVEGARPDVEEAYPDFPNNYKAGWGYMMLTNFLPGGDGTFTLHASAVDVKGNVATLGKKTIILDNVNAFKPFGAIDSPRMGQVVSGENYRNQGWALSPMPHTIPTDGSTIKVLIDGMEIGYSTYNIYREDIADLFPGYANSGGALAYFDFDSGLFKNGIHTIAWLVANDAGHTDGIGSRYFTIRNIGEIRSQVSRSFGDTEIPAVKGIPVPLIYFTAKGNGIEEHAVFPDGQGAIYIKIKELERVGIRLSHPGQDIIGYMVVGNQRRSLPVGSSLDVKSGTFFWQPGPGFIGEYKLVFAVLDPGEGEENKSDGAANQRIIIIKIEPVSSG